MTVCDFSVKQTFYASIKLSKVLLWSCFHKQYLEVWTTIIFGSRDGLSFFWQANIFWIKPSKVLWKSCFQKQYLEVPTALIFSSREVLLFFWKANILCVKPSKLLLESYLKNNTYRSLRLLFSVTVLITVCCVSEKRTFMHQTFKNSFGLQKQYLKVSTTLYFRLRRVMSVKSQCFFSHKIFTSLFVELFSETKIRSLPLFPVVLNVFHFSGKKVNILWIKRSKVLLWSCCVWRMYHRKVTNLVSKTANKTL